MILETLLGSGLGALARLAPEIITAIDRGNERKHELKMFDKQNEADRLRADQQLRSVETQGQLMLDKTGIEALRDAIKAQGQKTGVSWADAWNAIVRPSVTHLLVLLYIIAKCAGAYSLAKMGMPTADAVSTIWTPQDHALLSGILNFWFLDRVIRKRQGV